MVYTSARSLFFDIAEQLVESNTAVIKGCVIERVFPDINSEFLGVISTTHDRMDTFCDTHSFEYEVVTPGYGYVIWMKTN